MPEPTPGDRRVLLTGASGFVGRPCLELLAESGWQVHAVTSRQAPAEDHNVSWWQADLLDAGAIQALIREVRPTHLLHLAWTLDPQGGLYRSPENFRWVSASLELLRAFAEGGGERVVFVGSGAEYDWSAGQCSETATPLRPSTTYGLCKRALSELFDEFVTLHGPSLSGAWARLFFLYGPHEKPQRLIASVIGSLLRGQPTRCSHGRQLRDYLFTLDAADALVKLLGSEVTGAVNVASGEAMRLADLIQRTAARLGREDLVELGAIPVPADDPPLVVADVGRLHGELGWRPYWDVDDALDHTIAWWRGRVAGPEGET